jgi:catechol 2,3-dioxygenase-like lactoylglutathione lyase family enzyme
MTLPIRFAHANVNCRELARSERFYADVVGLVPRMRTAPQRTQDGVGFGLDGVQVRWDGVLLHDHRGPASPLVDLLEWKEPPTLGTAAAEPSHTGLSAFCFLVDDLDRACAALEAAGAAYQRVRHEGPDGAEDVVVAHDPDGTRAELRAGPAATYAGLRINCTDLDRSVAFYGATLKLEAGPERSVTVTGAGGEAGRFRARRLALPDADTEFTVELTRWDDPAPMGEPISPGHHAGIYRVALIVRDIDAYHAEMLAVVPDAPPPTDVSVGDEYPLVRASFFPDPDGATLELIRGQRL